MKSYLPTTNPITQGYSSTHRAYDFAGLNRPDEVRAAADGEIIERVDDYTTNWRNTGTLTTKDYGNYIKVKHTDGSYSLYAHLKKGSSFTRGTKVTAGQTIARIGNTGNSSGPHLHFELRTDNNVNVSADFYTQTEAKVPEFEWTDQTKIPPLDNQEVQAIRSQLKELSQLKTEVENLKQQIKESSTVTYTIPAKVPEVTQPETFATPLGRLFNQLARTFG